MEWIDAWKRQAFKRLHPAASKTLIGVCVCVCVCVSCPAGCNVAVFDLTVSQSTLTGFATGWPQCARPSSLRPRGLLKTPGRSPASPCDWSSNWARAASEKSGWVRGRHTRHAGTCSDNSSRCLAFCLVFSRSYVDMSTQDRPRFIQQMQQLCA